MKTFSALLALCAEYSPVTGEFPLPRSVTRSFDVFFDLHLNKRLDKQSRCRWFETPWYSLWRHSNALRDWAFIYIQTGASWDGDACHFVTCDDIILTNSKKDFCENTSQLQQIRNIIDNNCHWKQCFALIVVLYYAFSTRPKLKSSYTAVYTTPEKMGLFFQTQLIYRV